MASPIEDNSERNAASLSSPSTLSDNNNNRKRTSDEMLKSANKSDRLPSGDNGAFAESSQGTGTSVTVGDDAPSSGIHIEPSRDSRLSSEDLLAPIARYDWDEFQEQCRNGMHRLGAEEEDLMEQYTQWEWLHQIWSQSRASSDTIRLNQEICTISRWTELKEAELEEARVQHKQNMEQISRVLGIVSSP